MRGQGLLLGVELVADRTTLEPFPPDANLTLRAVTMGLAEGVFFYPAGSGSARDVLVLGPPYVLGDREIEKIGAVLPRAIDAAVASLG